MSSGIWSRCGGAENIRRLTGRAWRVVESQHIVSTRKLVDSAEEQELLEELIEEEKPSLPDHPSVSGMHYLLSTPFRYPPLAHGSRFGTRAEPSLWYGSSRLRTALSETAYYRLLFIEGTEAQIGPVPLELSAFRATVRTQRGVDLCRRPFDVHGAAISSPTDYDRAQRLGNAMRSAGVQAFRYRSARDVKGGINVALFTPAAFASPVPDLPENWSGTAGRDMVEFVKKDFFKRIVHRFPRQDFEVDGRLPAPAV